MSLDNYISLVSALIAFAGMLLLVWQLRDGVKQRESQSLVEIYDINRQLLSLGFDHPKLFAILEDAPNTDPTWERRYLQLWLNQLSLIHLYFKSSAVKGEIRDSLERDISYFMTLANMRRQWKRFGALYPASFQKLVNDIIEKIEPPHPAAAAQSDS